ncbi:MAG: PIN domain-containing protein [Gammaproteobacteria bacterium]|nr:MAG: PIN domain-containing protein [Gammaproteobacteria bacterium]
MKGIDTNVLVRYIVQDDPQQSRQATLFIEETCSDEKTIFITGIIICELVWVLEAAYDYPRQSIAAVIEKILETRQFHIFQSDILWKSLHDYQHLNVDFADSYINHLNVANGCEYTMTFDKKAARLKHFKRLGK